MGGFREWPPSMQTPPRSSTVHGPPYHLRDYGARPPATHQQRPTAVVIAPCTMIPSASPTAHTLAIPLDDKALYKARLVRVWIRSFGRPVRRLGVRSHPEAAPFRLKPHYSSVAIRSVFPSLRLRQTKKRSSKSGLLEGPTKYIMFNALLSELSSFELRWARC